MHQYAFIKLLTKRRNAYTQNIVSKSRKCHEWRAAFISVNSFTTQAVHFLWRRHSYRPLSDYGAYHDFMAGPALFKRHCLSANVRNICDAHSLLRYRRSSAISVRHNAFDNMKPEWAISITFNELILSLSSSLLDEISSNGWASSSVKF